MGGRAVGFEELVDDADFCFDGAAVVRGVSDPVDETFRFLWRGAVGRFFVGGADEGDGSRGVVLFERGGCDGEGDFHQTDGFTGGEAEVI